jgi:hypothetical protein
VFQTKQMLVAQILSNDINVLLMVLKVTSYVEKDYAQFSDSNLETEEQNQPWQKCLSLVGVDHR